VTDRWLNEETVHRAGDFDVHQIYSSDSETAVWFQVSRWSEGAWFQAALLRVNQPPIVLAEEEIPNPGSRWELRSSGLWADHNCETPLDHWSYGLEAFALAIDEPQQLVRDGVGDRVPIGWELDFEANEHSTQLAMMDSNTATSTDGYEQSGVVHGLILTAMGKTAFEGPARRQHWWGTTREGPASISLEGADGVRSSIQDFAAVPVGGQVWTVARTGGASRLGEIARC
jgi:hypothetical protein